MLTLLERTREPVEPSLGHRPVEPMPLKRRRESEMARTVHTAVVAFVVLDDVAFVAAAVGETVDVTAQASIRRTGSCKDSGPSPTRV